MKKFIALTLTSLCIFAASNAMESQKHPLVQAAEKGDDTKLQMLLADPMLFHLQPGITERAFKEAAYHGNLNAIKLLLGSDFICRQLGTNAVGRALRFAMGGKWAKKTETGIAIAHMILARLSKVLNEKETVFTLSVALELECDSIIEAILDDPYLLGLFDVGEMDLAGHEDPCDVKKQRVLDMLSPKREAEKRKQEVETKLGAMRVRASQAKQTREEAYARLDELERQMRRSSNPSRFEYTPWHFGML